MATNFPTSLDNLTNPAGSDPVNNPSHASQHANLNDAIEKLEEKVGVNNSAVTTSLDYRVKQLETNPVASYTNEEAVDAVALALAAGTHSNITINYNDTGNSISISAAAGYTDEEARDAVALALRGSGGITISSDDSANTITISVDNTIATKTYVDTAVSNLGSTAASTYVPVSEVGNADGIATLDENARIPLSQLGNLIDGAPAALDTLNELAAAINDDASYAAGITTALGSKLDSTVAASTYAPLASPTFTTQVRLPSSVEGPNSSTSVNMFFGSGAANLTFGGGQTTGNLTIGGGAGRTTGVIGIGTGATTTGTKTINIGTGSTGGTTAITVGSSSGATSNIILNGSISPLSSSTVGLTVKGIASQTADLQQWQNSTGTAIAKIDSTGAMFTITPATGTNTTQVATTAFVQSEIDASVQPGALYQTTAPTSPEIGQIWIDSDEDVTTFDSNIIRRKAITATAGQTVFTADLPFIDGFEQIFMNGLLLVKTTDYATSGGNTVTLTSAAVSYTHLTLPTILRV